MAYKFQRGNAILSGALEQEGNITIDGGKLTASAGFEGASLTVQDSVIVSNARALAGVTSISGAGVIQGNNLSLGGGKVTTTAAGQVNGLALSGTAQLESAKLKIDNQVIVSQARALANVTSISGAGVIQGNNLSLGGGLGTISAAGAVAGVSVSGTAQLASAKLTINGSDVITQAKALGNVTTISGASRISGNDLALGGGTATISAAGAIAGSSVSGTVKLESAKLNIDGSTIITQARALGNVTTVSGASRISGNDLRLGGGTATISAAGAVAGTSLSGTTNVSSAKLTIDGSVIVTQGRNLQNVTSISGAGKVEAALLDINGSTIVTQAKALQNVTSISGAGRISGNDLRLGGGKATISAAGAVAGTSLSGTTKVESAKLSIDGTDVITQARALQNVTSISGAGTVKGAAATFRSVTAGTLTDTRITIGGPNGKLVDNAGFKIATGSSGHVLTLSGTKAAGGIHSEIHFGDNKSILSYLSGNSGGEPEHQLKLGTSNSDVEVAISASHGRGLFLAGGDGTEGGVYVAGANGFKVEDGSENVNVELKPSGIISGSGDLKVGGSVRLDGVAAATVNQAADSIYFLDGDNLVKRDTIVDFVAAIAGSGLSAGSGKLSTQGSAVATQFNTNQALSEGYNVYTGSGDVTVQLEDRPAGNLTAGDIFVIKQGGTGKVTISSSSPETTIDGVSGSVLLESPFAAVNLLFVDYGRGGPKFRIV